MADSYDPDDLQTERPSGTPVVKVRPRKEGGPRSDKNDGDSSISPTMNQIIDHIAQGESGGRYDVIYGGRTVPIGEDKDHPRIAVPITSGPNKGRTSSAFGGLQFIGSTWDWVAEHTGKHDTSEESQKINGAWLARHTYEQEHPGRDIEADWASGDPDLRKDINRALGTQWESLAAGPRVSNLDASGRPKLGFGFSDYAMKEHDGRPDTDIQWMSPADYLDLSPPLEKKPFENPSGRSLMNSFRKGDQIESMPTLDTTVDGDTATVTDQDGRHRALLAQKEGVSQIPVAMRKTGEGDPTQITGMDGKTQPFKRQPQQEEPEQQKEPISLLRKAADAIIPRAEAAEAPENPYAKYTQPTEEPAANPYGKYTQQSVGQNVEGMTEEEARGANLSDADQKRWMAAQQSRFGIDNEVPAAITRGVAPIAAGAGVGAGIGGAVAGPPGAIVGAGVGAGTAGLGELVGGLTGAPKPSDATNALLDMTNMRKVETPEGRVVEQAAAGGANALSGAEGIGLIAKVLRTPAGRVTANYLMKTAAKAADALSTNPELQTVSGITSGAASQEGAELHLPRELQVLLGLVAGALPAHRVVAPNLGKIEASQEAKKAIEAGFVLHPADAEAGRVGSSGVTASMAAEAGKTKTLQKASVDNAVRATEMARADIGLPDKGVLMPAAFDQAKQPAAAIFREMEAAVPEVDLARNPDYVKLVDALGGRTAETERLFPDMAGTPEILELRDQIKANERGATHSVMQKIADLREKAVANYRVDGEGAAAAHRLAGAQRQAASIMEDAMEDSVKNAPRYFQEKVNEARAKRAEATADFDYINRSVINDPLSQTSMGKMREEARRRVEAANAESKKWEDRLANAKQNVARYAVLPLEYQKARTLFAKIYDVMSVTNKSTGVVNARGLGAMAQKGKPLSGNLKTIADAANSFPRAFQNPAMIGGVESMSVLDAGGIGVEMAKGLGKIAAGHHSGWANLGLGLAIMLRKAVRGKLMSPEYQKAMIKPHVQPELPSSLLTAPWLQTQQPNNQDPGVNALLGMMTQQ